MFECPCPFLDDRDIFTYTDKDYDNKYHFHPHYYHIQKSNAQSNYKYKMFMNSLKPHRQSAKDKPTRKQKPKYTNSTGSLTNSTLYSYEQAKSTHMIYMDLSSPC